MSQLVGDGNTVTEKGKELANHAHRKLQPSSETPTTTVGEPNPEVETEIGAEIGTSQDVVAHDEQATPEPYPETTRKRGRRTRVRAPLPAYVMQELSTSTRLAARPTQACPVPTPTEIASNVLDIFPGERAFRGEPETTEHTRQHAQAITIMAAGLETTWAKAELAANPIVAITDPVPDRTTPPAQRLIPEDDPDLDLDTEPDHIRFDFDRQLADATRHHASLMKGIEDDGVATTYAAASATKPTNEVPAATRADDASEHESTPEPTDAAKVFDAFDAVFASPEPALEKTPATSPEAVADSLTVSTTQPDTTPAAMRVDDAKPSEPAQSPVSDNALTSADPTPAPRHESRADPIPPAITAATRTRLEAALPRLMRTALDTRLDPACTPTPTSPRPRE